VLCLSHGIGWSALTLFSDVLSAWYGPQWRRTAPPSLGRSRRTIGRWAADDARVPRWAWLRFADDERAMERWRGIDRREAEDHVRLAEAAQDQKGAISRACRLSQWQLHQMELKPDRRPGRPRAHRPTKSRPVTQPLLRDRARQEQ
jgi:hypothetical protein